MSTKLPTSVSGSMAWSIHPALSSAGVFMNAATTTTPASSISSRKPGAPRPRTAERAMKNIDHTTSSQPPCATTLVQALSRTNDTAFQTWAKERCTAPMRKHRSMRLSRSASQATWSCSANRGSVGMPK